MKKSYFLLFILLVQICFSQIEDAWVYFNDKPSANSFLSNPLSMLTQRALDRRVAQNISLDITDVPVEHNYISQIAAIPGITVMAKSKWLNALHIRGTQATIQSLTNLAFVNYIRYANHALNPTGRNVSSQNSNSYSKNLNVQVNYNYGTSANQIEMLNGHLLHQQNYTGQGKVIAILDSGFIGVDTAVPFQSLLSNNQILGGYNFPDANSNYFTRHNHGTMVLSCMGGNVNGQLVGTAPDAKYYLFITEDVNSENPVEESYWVEAAELADYYGVDVINSSLGYFEYDNPSYSYQYADMTGIKTFAARGATMAFQKGIVVVISAGNSGATSNPHIGTPADALGALTVGAVDGNEAYVSFSSIGPSYDNRVKPDVCAKGLNATISTTTGSIVMGSGTSFSSPIIAGMVATFWSAVPNLTAAQVVQFVKQSADQYTSPSPQKGYGIPDFQLALNNAMNMEVNELPNNFYIFPNPTTDLVFFHMEDVSDKGTISVYNVMGQLIAFKEFEGSYNAFIDMEDFKTGIYYYTLDAKNSHKGKILKK